MQVIIQLTADKRLDAAVGQGRRIFGEVVAKKFYNQVIHTIQLLAANPYMGERQPELDTLHRQYRTLVVHPHFKLVYYVDEPGQRLYITTLWDVRRAPTTLVVSK